MQKRLDNMLTLSDKTFKNHLINTNLNRPANLQNNISCLSQITKASKKRELYVIVQKSDIFLSFLFYSYCQVIFVFHPCHQ